MKMKSQLPITGALKFSDRLRWARRLKGKTLRQVGDEVSISDSYLSQLETGKINDPGVHGMVALARYYGVTVEELIG